MPVFDEGLGARVDGGSGLVEDEYGRVLHGGAGDGQQLPLALREAGAIGCNHGIVALGQATDEGIGVGDARGALDFLPSGIQLAKADIVGDGAAEEVRILQDDAQRAAQVVLADVAHVDAIVDDAALMHIVEAVDEVGDGGLARAGGADESDLLAGFGVKGDIVEDGLALLIAKIDVFKAHIAAQGRARAVLPQPIPALAVLRAREAHVPFRPTLRMAGWLMA